MITVKEIFPMTFKKTVLWKREYTRKWQIVTDSASIGPVAIAAELPVDVGYTWDYRGDIDKGSFCQEISLDRDLSANGPQDGKQWIATATYGPYDPNQKPENPLLHPLEPVWDWMTIERPLIFDADDDTIAALNSAGDPFDPPALVEEHFPVLTVVRNEASNSPALNYKYRSAVNSDIFLLENPGTWRSFPIGIRQIKDQDIGWYFQKTYKFAFDPDGWNKGILDQGMFYLKDVVAGGDFEFPTATVTKVPITHKGVPVSKPALLDGDGYPLPPDAKPEDAVFLDIRKYKSLPFDVFNISFDQFPQNTPP